jgi:hypothetical protein
MDEPKLTEQKWESATGETITLRKWEYENWICYDIDFRVEPTERVPGSHSTHRHIVDKRPKHE